MIIKKLKLLDMLGKWLYIALSLCDLMFIVISSNCGLALYLGTLNILKKIKFVNQKNT